MTTINPGIFKRYDIRGKAEGTGAAVTMAAAHAIGAAFGTYLQRFEHQQTVVVGRDNRRTSFELARAVMEGLKQSGCKVYNLELLATPILYWNAVRRGNVGGVMVTGSHLPPEQNGFKLCVGGRSIYGSQLQSIRGFIDTRDLTYGSGELTTDHTSYLQYVKDLAERLPMGARKLRVVVDAGNGIGGLFAPNLIKAWGHELAACLYCNPDGNFPNHPANPQEESTLRDLSAKVLEVGADIGIAFDGDADRMGIVDERGHMMAADRVLALLARDMLTRRPNSAVVADVLSSQVLFDEIKRAGGRPVMCASGHALVKARMSEVKSLLGGEMSGHIFLGEDYYGYDDGFFAAGRFLQLLSNTTHSVSQLDNTLPRLFSTPEYRPHCADEYKLTVINAVRDALESKGEVTSVDGVRVQFERGWGLLRASNTEPVLSLRFEAETESDALAYRDLFANVLAAFPQVGALE